MKRIDNSENMSLVTYDILKRIKELRKKILNSMIIEKDRVIRGIDFFEERIVLYNPLVIDEDEFSKIESYILMDLNNREEKFQRIDSYFRCGLNQCMMMMSIYMLVNKYDGKVRVRERVNL